MSLADKQLLVTGANGNLGKAAVAELRRLGAKQVIAATRTPGKLQELAALGVEERQADFDRPEILQAAFRGVERLLLVSTDSLHAPEVRIKQHRAAIQAAVGAGVEHVVYTSLPNAHPTEGPSIPDDHFWTEVALFESGLNWTILRNNLYAEVILRFAHFALKTGKLVSATQSRGRSYVTREDCARTAAAALLNSTGKAIYDVTGPASVTHEQVASVLSRLSGKSIQHVNVTSEEVEKGLVAAGIPQFAARVCVSWMRRRRVAIMRSSPLR
jgi:NAD(P)H dehydrogenase (quinone)